MRDSRSRETTGPEKLYLDLLKGCLTRSAFGEKYEPIRRPVKVIRRRLWWAIYPALRTILFLRDLELVRRVHFDPEKLLEGRYWLNWPAEAETMIGLKRLDNLERCITDVLSQRIPGDLLEAGVWRGGAAIFMRAVLSAHRDSARTVWVADSFQGLPKPDPERYPADAGVPFFEFNHILGVSLEEVKGNFARYGLLDEQVRFLVGWFRDTLPQAPVERLAVLRLDGDMYESTIETLNALYVKLSIGGYVIIDDYGALPGCRAAVPDFRAQHGITEELRHIDWTGVFWQRIR